MKWNSNSIFTLKSKPTYDLHYDKEQRSYLLLIHLAIMFCLPSHTNIWLSNFFCNDTSFANENESPIEIPLVAYATHTYIISLQSYAALESIYWPVLTFYLLPWTIARTLVQRSYLGSLGKLPNIIMLHCFLICDANVKVQANVIILSERTYDRFLFLMRTYKHHYNIRRRRKRSSLSKNAHH